MTSDTLQQLYRQALSTPSDIREHLDTLYQLARGCDHVTKMGTRNGISTCAFLYAQPEVLVCYDRVRLPGDRRAGGGRRAAGHPRFLFVQADVRRVEIDPTDLLFIDTWHVYEQMQQASLFHATRPASISVFHDARTFGDVGETAGHRGIRPAVEEFLADHPHWSPQRPADPQ